MSNIDKVELIAYTDASYDQKRSIAGWGVVLQIKKKGVTKEHAFRNYLPCSSNNYAELFAIHQALILLAGNKHRTTHNGSDAKIIIYTDSQTALDYLNGLRGKEYQDRHMPRWTKEQYMEHKRMSLLTYKIKKICNSDVEYRKVKGHCKDYQEEHLENNLADGYAKIGRSLYYKNNPRLIMKGKDYEK